MTKALQEPQELLLLEDFGGVEEENLKPLDYVGAFLYALVFMRSTEPARSPTASILLSFRIRQNPANFSCFIAESRRRMLSFHFRPITAWAMYIPCLYSD